MSSSSTTNAREEAINVAKSTGATDLNKLPYECGDCSAVIYIGPGDPIHCHECGSRIFYKMRTKQPVQYSAR